VSNWSNVTLAEALGILFYAIVLPSPRLAPRESGSSTTARRFQTKPSAATIHVGVGGDSHWICFRHYYKWNADRARFLADGGGCAMQKLGELLEGED